MEHQQHKLHKLQGDPNICHSPRFQIFQAYLQSFVQRNAPINGIQEERECVQREHSFHFVAVDLLLDPGSGCLLEFNLRQISQRSDLLLKHIMLGYHYHNRFDFPV